MGLERGLNGWPEQPQLIAPETRQIEPLGRAGLEIGAPSRPHGGGLLPLEAQDTINRDELYSLADPVPPAPQHLPR